MAQRLADVQNMTAEEVTNALLAQQIRAHHFRGAENNAILIDMLIKINQHFQNLKRDLEVIRDEIRTVSLRMNHTEMMMKSQESNLKTWKLISPLELIRLDLSIAQVVLTFQD